MKTFIRILFTLKQLLTFFLVYIIFYILKIVYIVIHSFCWVSFIIVSLIVACVFIHDKNKCLLLIKQVTKKISSNILIWFCDIYIQFLELVKKTKIPIRPQYNLGIDDIYTWLYRFEDNLIKQRNNIQQKLIEFNN